MDLGRRDRQVKVHGHRTELGEIEERLVSHPAVDATAVILSTSAKGGQRLVAYYVSSSAEGCLDELDLMRWCAKTLPRAMVPTKYVRVDALPLTVNGKLDRRALEDIQASS